jgi:hypothetical protein
VLYIKPRVELVVSGVLLLEYRVAIANPCSSDPLVGHDIHDLSSKIRFARANVDTPNGTGARVSNKYLVVCEAAWIL